MQKLLRLTEKPHYKPRWTIQSTSACFFSYDVKWHVVGVNEAPTSQMLPPLKHAESDAQAVATLLTQRKCGFALHERVFLGEDATASTVMDALSDLADELGQDDLLMVYFYDHEQPMLIEAERKDVYLVTHDLNERRAKKR